MNELIELVGQLRDAAIEWLPRLAASLGLLFVGWLIAVLFCGIVRRVLRSLVRVIPRKSSGFEAAATQLGGKAESVFPVVTFWFILLLFTAAAVEVLGLPILTAWIGEVVGYLPNIVLALLILFGGLWAGGAIGAFTARALVGTRHGALMGRIAQFSIAAVSVVVGIAQLGVDLSFLTTIVSIAVAGILLAGSLAFGLGSKGVVGNILAAHYVEKIYRVGHQVEVDGVSGTIVDIADTFVLIETRKGRVAVPARLFVEKSSTRPTEGSDE